MKMRAYNYTAAEEAGLSRFVRDRNLALVRAERAEAQRDALLAALKAFPKVDWTPTYMDDEQYLGAYQKYLAMFQEWWTTKALPAITEAKREE